MSIKFKEKVGYAFGDFASSLFWKLFSMFLMIFYTDVVELSPASVGTMLLIVRLWDSFVDPLVGIVADRTNTKWGKFRPYLLWTAVPFGIAGMLTFTSPSFGPSGKLVYAYLTYTLMMMIYSCINVPYASMMGVMTNKPEERTSLASFRFIGAYGGGIFMTATVPYLLDFFKGIGSSDAISYQYTVSIYAVVAAFFFIMTFLWTKERVKPLIEPTSIKSDLKDLAKNAQWFIMLGAGVSNSYVVLKNKKPMNYHVSAGLGIPVMTGNLVSFGVKYETQAGAGSSVQKNQMFSFFLNLTFAERTPRSKIY